MSMLRMQADELRRLAGIARGYAEVDARENGRALLFESAEAMREAADTIESLRDRLQELQGVGGGECELVYGENDKGIDSWFTGCGGRFAATFEKGRMVHPRFCQLCGGEAVER